MSRFQTTRWSLIAAARDQPARAREALEQLCRTYRPPVLAFVRHSGYPAADAEDLTQAFFLRFIERGWYADADPERGRFRSLLLVSLRRFIGEERDRAGALKRGGGQAHQDDALDGVAGGESPDEAFARAWLGTVLARAMSRLQREWERAGKGEQFEQLAPLLVEGADSEQLHALALATQQRGNTIAVRAHRMRKRLRQLVQLELLQTVSSREQLEEELADMRDVLDEAP